MVNKKVIHLKTQKEAELAEMQIVELSKRIEFYLTEYSVELLADKMKKGDFVVPDYQREYTWEDERKSRFIESLMIGLPIPFLFFWEMPDGRLEIVDGSQRLRTIEEFIYKDFRLGELESLEKLSGFKFSELLDSRKRKTLNRSVRGIVLNEHADEQARFDMFDRINTGSKVANKAEIRRGALAGPFMNMITKCAEMPLFEKLAPVSQKEKNERVREELITRYFAYGDDLSEYKDKPSEFLFNYVKKMNRKAEEDASLVEEYSSDFLNSMKFVDEVFPYGFRKTVKGKATPKARFESIAIGVKMALKEKPELSVEEVGDVRIWMEDKEFPKVTGSDGANAKARLLGRINFVKTKLLGG
ncbi:hypothetical protein HVA01_23960 [Halovibrio variabilis]|uniref:GmrSD restriction endonucleases N-terminal domain-containing protein n=1 Tax=Halovibrio variabilis TaxID=31910 RepID=A0A511UQ96_9GAMM|nr:DUF262 domain-containing protein [Halovibrio variabilis]GEN28750.1 hypothetical protein HVA01_23960 [Halovibrio variabilis]